ncbi:MAG: RNA 2',3'-cyclic phosphodiesterase [Anaerolineales bacterium]|nr:MAG: RNA 2',3'-cyclic phosphodiesterase [Anaerolineales bacterium]
MRMMRAFIAVNIPLEVKGNLQEEIGRLRTLIRGGPVRWVRPEGIHLTLKFLGEISNSNLGEIGQVLEREVNRHPFFTLRVGGFGCFPNRRRPRVLWIGITEENGTLAQVQTAIEEKLVPLGFGKEGRPFHPHLTLGRVRRNISMSELPQLQDAVDEFVVGQIGHFEVSELHLIRSILRSSGAEYSTLMEFPLGSKGDE